MMEALTVFVPEIRLNNNHVSIIFRLPYWLVGVLVLVLTILRWQDKSIDILLVTSFSTWVFWILNRVWPIQKDRYGGVWIKYVGK